MDFNTQGKFKNTQVRANIRQDKTQEEKTLEGKRANSKEETQKLSFEGINIAYLARCQVSSAEC